MFSSMANLPFLFLLIPLIFSVLSIVQTFRFTNIVMNLLVITFIISLSFYLFSDVIINGAIEYTFNSNHVFLLQGYRISPAVLLSLIMIFVLKFINFLLFDDSKSKIGKHNLVFAIYMINYFAICGLLITRNILNLYLYLEIYSVTLYLFLSDYNKNDLVNVGYKYYINGILGSILILFFVLIVCFTFGTSNLPYIVEHLSSVHNNLFYYLSVMLLLVGVFFKFFSFCFYFNGIAKSYNIVNFLFVNMLFSDIIIGFYFTRKMFLLFDIVVLERFFYIKECLFVIGSLIIIQNALTIFQRKNLTIYIYNFSLILLGYLIILFAFDDRYAIIASISLIINHMTATFLFYVIIALLTKCYYKSDIIVIHFIKQYRFIIYLIILSHLGFPFAFGFTWNWNYLLTVISEKKYYLLATFFFEKVCMAVLLFKINYSFTQAKKNDLLFFGKVNIYEGNAFYIFVIGLIIFITILVTCTVNYLPVSSFY